MDTREFFQTILPDEGIFYLAIFRDGYQFPQHKVFTDHYSMAVAVENYQADDKVSVYHACGSYQQAVIEIEDGEKVKRKYRIPENWDRAKAFWMDIDCGEAKAAKGDGYPTKKGGAMAVSRFAKEIGWPQPMLVDSGNGIHAYWPLAKPIKHDKWVKVAKILKATAAHKGLIADPTRTADFASILRPAGGVNRKGGSVKHVKVLRHCEPCDPKILADSLLAVARDESVIVPKERPPKVQAQPGLNDDLIAHLENLPQLESSGDLVADSCLQMAAMRSSKGDVSYEHWRGAIGVLKHCTDGEQLAEEWSSEREATGHSQLDWRVRYDTWSAGPATCDFFEGCNPDGCSGCIHKGKIKSPIVLGRIIPITEEKVVEVKAEEGGTEQVVVPALPFSYSWDDKHMVRSIVDKDGITQPHAFSANLFYPTMRIRKEDGTFNIGIRMHLPDGRVRDFEIPFEALASQTDLLRAMAKYELIQSNHKDSGGNMVAYLRDSMEKLKREIEEVNTLTTYGWKYDMQAFLIGDRLYHKDGSVRRVLLGGYAAGKREVFPAPRGTLAGYAEPLNFIYNRPGMECMQYALCSGWGSILAPFCEDLYKGLMFSLYSGRSGTGKSTVCYNSLYAFGNADRMAKKSEDMGTKNELYATIGTFNNIPLLFDELTKIEPEDLSSMAYRISLGEERGRLKNTAGGTRFADTASWRMSPFVTSNKDLHALLSMTQANAEAEAVRVVQVHLDDFNIPELKGADLTAFQMACDQIKLNAGVAGDAMIRYAVTHVDELHRRMREKVTMLARHIGEPKFRFYRSHAACTLVMAEIAKELGIIEFNVDALTEFSISLMLRLKGTIAVSTATTPEDAYARMLSALNNRIIVTTELRDARHASGPETPRRPITGEAAGRYVAAPPNSKDPARGRLYLAQRDVRDWCTKNRIDVHTLLGYLRDHGALVADNEKMRLTKGTDLSGGQTWCYVINTLKLEDASGHASPTTRLVAVGTEQSEAVANGV